VTARRGAAGLCALLWAAAHPAAAGGGPPPVELFDLADVRLLPGPFAHAQDLNRRMLLAHEPDRFLAPFRVEAGLPPRADKYPNWESTGLDGHTTGHYLTALAQAWATTGDAEIKRRLDYMVAELAACQRAHGNGYVGAIPGGKSLWTDVAAGRLAVESFAINGKWVPWYNQHKLFAGLRDVWALTGNTQARDVLVGLADWCAGLVAGLTDAQVQEMLRAEHGGMNEVLADVAALTGDARYVAVARRFSHRAVLEPLVRREDALTGLHANTQIPKAVGFARVAELAQDREWAAAARFFWDTVVRKRSVAFGGNSVREHFHPAGDFSSMVESREGPETCNTYNMLRLTEQLFRGGPAAPYADYYERALYNHILSAQHPGHGGFVYFTPIRPRHYRVYSQPGRCYWCCVGSGMESQGKYGRFVYARGKDALYVSLFVASELRWRDRGLTVTQETAFPDEERTRLVFRTPRPQRLTVHVRHPAWVKGGALTIRIGGKPWPVSSAAGSYVAIDRTWRDGDRAEIDLPMRTAVERLPDGSDYVALLHGPIVLAARTGPEGLDGLLAGDDRMGHVAPGPYLPLEGAPMLVGDVRTLASRIRPVTGRPLTFTAGDVIEPQAFRGLELVPFFRVHDSRYMVYWRTVSREGYPALVTALAAGEKSRLDLEARTLDQVAAGEQQPEVEHHFAGEGSSTGIHLGRRWRDAASWFGYTLKADPAAAMDLVVTYSAGDRRRRFDILAGERLVAEVSLEGGNPDRFVDVAYAVPAGAVREDGTLHVRFVAKSGSRAGAVYGVRLVRR
jgi:uncharacterized protein